MGTKQLTEEYIEEVVKHFHIICETNFPELAKNAKYEFIANTQRAFGRTALLLSGGATLGIHHLAFLRSSLEYSIGLTHIGVIKVLHETKLLPRVISGSSVGSIVAAVVCTRTDKELPYMLDPRNLNLVHHHLHVLIP